MEIIKTIDLWTEQLTNHYECFNGAFIDGFESGKNPYDTYKIVRNCNCLIYNNSKTINITNNHQAIIFYKKGNPVRLMVINKDTNVDKCISIALNQYFKSEKLNDFLCKLKVKSYTVDLREESVFNKANRNKEIDVGSCDRWNLLYCMLKGSYTESTTPYGNFASDKYEFVPEINIKYELKTDTEIFTINHNCAFINVLGTRIILIQENSPLTK